MKQLMYLGAVGAQAVASAALIPVLTHSLTPADYGTVGVIAVIQQFVTMFVGLGLPGMVTSWESGAATGQLRRGALLPVLAPWSAVTQRAALSKTPWLLYTSPSPPDD